MSMKTYLGREKTLPSIVTILATSTGYGPGIDYSHCHVHQVNGIGRMTQQVLTCVDNWR